MKKSYLKTLLLVTVGMGLVPAHAFPPAPHHLLFGAVRDELGRPIQQGAIVYLEAEGTILAYGSVVNDLLEGRNYQLSIPMDSGYLSERYASTALRPWAAFRLRVQIGDQSFLPIEMRGDAAKLGEPSLQTRLDLTLGEDSDGDGLPDAWERAYTGGLDQDGLGDADGDGLSNFDEYLGKTYTDEGDQDYELKILGLESGLPQLEFLAAPGRSYSLLGSSDMKVWTPVPFVTNKDGNMVNQYQSVDVQKVRIGAQVETGTIQFFRLRVDSNSE